MKVLSVVFAGLLATGALATPTAEPDAEAIIHFCHRPGQSCGKLKRAADAAAEALALADPEADPRIIHFCHRPGQSCGKAKRAADALANAVAEAAAVADAVANPIIHFCHRPGQSCGKAKREAGELL